MPFSGYKDFADCVSKNSDKEDAKAYCGALQKKAEASSKTIEVNGKTYIVVAENVKMKITANIQKVEVEDGSK